MLASASGAGARGQRGAHRPRPVRPAADGRTLGAFRRRAGGQLRGEHHGQRGGAQPGGGGEAGIVAPGLSRPQRPARLSYSAPSADGGGQVERHTESSGDKFAKVGRNAPCPCGSGRKYKLCHGDPRNRANG